jgi:hypothetical protein
VKLRVWAMGFPLMFSRIWAGLPVGPIVPMLISVFQSCHLSYHFQRS